MSYSLGWRLDSPPRSWRMSSCSYRCWRDLLQLHLHRHHHAPTDFHLYLFCARISLLPPPSHRHLRLPSWIPPDHTSGCWLVSWFGCPPCNQSWFVRVGHLSTLFLLHAWCFDCCLRQLYQHSDWGRMFHPTWHWRWLTTTTTTGRKCTLQHNYQPPDWTLTRT